MVTNNMYIGTDQGEQYNLDPRHLTTHMMIVGMTGSGKTGAGLVLLEELALAGIPTIAIDPKGDLANLMLPLRGVDQFLPWVHEEDADRLGLTRAQLARQVSKAWGEGQKFDKLSDRVERMQSRMKDTRIYTPASSAGIPLSVIRSFAAPPAGTDPESLRERITTTTSSLLGLLGVRADPIRSHEHVLVSNLLQYAWDRGEDMDLYKLVAQVQNPPFEFVQAIDIDTFLDERKRAKLAVRINNLMASPSFAAWMDGDALDFDEILRVDGRPQTAIFSIAHLDDLQRTFFVSLLLSEYNVWMRQQRSSTNLQTCIYMDEIAGYMPPVKMPPTKTPMLTLLKQGRAFGTGLVLATQNPVDMDYKALSNMGIWMIGRLQTERDKKRLLQGLLTSDRPLNKRSIERMLASSSKRVFCLHNVHEEGKDGFRRLRVRHTASYLKGPMQRAEIAQVMLQHTKGRTGEMLRQQRLDDAEVRALARKQQRVDGLQLQLDKALDELDAERRRLASAGGRRVAENIPMALVGSRFMRAHALMRMIKGMSEAERLRLDKKSQKVVKLQEQLERLQSEE